MPAARINKILLIAIFYIGPLLVSRSCIVLNSTKSFWERVFRDIIFVIPLWNWNSRDFTFYFLIYLCFRSLITHVLIYFRILIIIELYFRLALYLNIDVRCLRVVAKTLTHFLYTMIEKFEVIQTYSSAFLANSFDFQFL